MVVSERESHWDYFHLLGSFEERRKFNYAVKLYVLFINQESNDETREYILTRVIQALGAVSNSMRAGAYSLFCTLLVNSPDMIEYETVKKIVNEHLKPAFNMKVDPEANVGQLLAYKALIQSKFLEKTPSLFNEIADNLMELSEKKSYLHGECLRLLGQITTISKQEYGSDVFLRNLKNLDTSTLDKLEYLLVLDRNIEESETLNYLFDGKRLLSPGTAPEVGILLAKCQNPSHSFYGKFFEAIADNPKNVSKLWKTYEGHIKDKVDTNKLALNMYYTLENEILQQLLRKKIFKPVHTIVSDTSIEIMLKNSKNKDLTKAVCKSISEILQKANDSKLSLDMLNKMVFNPGNFSFDEITGSKVVATALRSLGPQETKDFANKCLEVVVQGEGMKIKDRINALNLYCNLLDKSKNTDEKDVDWKVAGLKTLLKAGLLDEGNVSTELAAAIRKSFFNSLSFKFPSLPTYANALKELVKCLNSCLKKKLKIKITDTVKNTWAMSQELISRLAKSLKKHDDDKKILINALELVACYITLKSIYEPKECQFNLTDLKSVLERIDSGEDSEGPEWIEVVIDLFLSMLSKKNASNRKIVSIVFKSMVSHVNDGAFMQLVDVLRPGYDLKGGDDIEDDDGQEESNEDTSDDSEDDGEIQTEEQDDDNDDDDETEDDDMEDEDMNSRSFNMEKLQFDLRNALTPADSDNESANIDDLDEEQGKQLDATLSAIFKNAKIKKPKETKEKITTHFRSRVFDLLETYCLAGMPMDHWLTLIPSVLELANHLVSAKNAAGLKHRLLTFLKRVSSSTISNIGAEDFDPKPLVQLLEHLVTRAASATGTEKDLGEHFLQLVKFCIKNTNLVHGTNAESLKESMNILGTLAVEIFCSERSTLHRASLIIMQYLCTSNWCGLHNMMNILAEHTLDKSTKPFKRLKGIELLSSYAKSDRLFSPNLQPDTKDVKQIFDTVLYSLLELKSNGLFDLAIIKAIIKFIVNLHGGKCSSFIDWKKWNAQIPQLLSVDSGSFKKLKSKLSSLSTNLGLDVNTFIEDDAKLVMKKRQQQPQQNQQTQSNRKRKQVDARKLKKESKVRRLATMDGLDNLSWSKLNTDE